MLYEVITTNAEAINKIFSENTIDGVIHLAAESHVDRSITDPLSFINTNIIGTVNLLNAAKDAWKGCNFEGKRFYHISTRITSYNVCFTKLLRSCSNILKKYSPLFLSKSAILFFFLSLRF